VKLILTGIGFNNISKAINREKEISKNYPAHPIFYLWFIGVQRDKQNNGVGKQLMSELLNESERMKRPVYLETSTMKNLPWYKKFGLDVYNQLNFGYNLFLIRNELS
jgi:ribosomal protein S18 acetylase RimI-like enzyme